MECERLNRLIRSWYEQLLDESMAPARMVEFMEKHINECEICLTDPDVRYEVKKITAIILPKNKIIKPAKKAKPVKPTAPAAPAAPAGQVEQEAKETKQQQADDNGKPPQSA